MKPLAALGLLLGLLLGMAATWAGGGWCLGLGNLGPIRAGMKVEDVLRLADFSGMERKRPAEGCWYLSYLGRTPEFQLMIIDGQVARIEIWRTSTVNTISGAHIGISEQELRNLYGARLDMQPHKYVEGGHVFTFRSPDGEFGLRFESESGMVTSMQSATWEHLNYVEGCS